MKTYQRLWMVAVIAAWLAGCASEEAGSSRLNAAAPVTACRRRRRRGSWRLVRQPDGPARVDDV